MGKPRMDLLRGIEEQENAIENSKTYQEKEAYEAIGREKTWAGKTIKETPKEIKDEPTKEQSKIEPYTQDTLQTIQKPQTTSETLQTVKSTPTEEKVGERVNTKPQKQTFSFRACLDNIQQWKLYAELCGIKDIGELWTAAITEYINSHPLESDKQEMYNLRLEYERKNSR